MAVELNPQQNQAVTTTSHYVRVIAGAGSGKTRVLTQRVAHLIENIGCDPRKIVAITFTNKAANEMKKRIKDLLGEKGLGPHISTIHSLCVRILREDIRNLGYPANFTVMDTDDQKSILKEAYQQVNLDVKTVSFGAMLGYISDMKYDHIPASQAVDTAEGFSHEKEKALVYQYYTRRQNEMYALDFDDLLLVTVDLMKKNTEVLQKWQRRFQYILVDEFQDIDNVQYELIRLLAGDTNEVYVVGDPDQTIYTWRGANVEIIMNFEKDFKPCETIMLTQNYRSSPMILNAANSLIANNRERLKKDLFTSRTEGDKILHYTAQSEEDEAEWIARKILELHNMGLKYSSIAILYRANYLSRSLEKGLRDFRVPYVVYGGLRFYDRAEIKDMLSYLRMLVTADDLAFKRVMNQPKRNLGSKTQDALYDAARERGITMFQAIEYADINDGTRKRLREFRQLIDGFKQDMDVLPLDKLLEEIFEKTGYRSMLEKDKEDEKIANVKELMNDMEDFMENYPDSDLSEYLQMVNLYTDHEEEVQTEFVQLMTVHAAKGLEFDNVFVAGLSDGIFPSERTIAEGKKGLEEERRLAYVAFTRAKDRLYLTEPQGFSYVLSKSRMPSRFINEIDEEYIKHIGNQFQPSFQRDRSFIRPSYEEQEPQGIPAPVAAPHKAKFRNGDLVVHTAFGEGVVVKVKGNIMDVAFPYPHGIKTLMMGHPAIRKK